MEENLGVRWPSGKPTDGWG